MSWNKHKASEEDVVLKTKTEEKKMICIFFNVFYFSTLLVRRGPSTSQERESFLKYITLYLRIRVLECGSW